MILEIDSVSEIPLYQQVRDQIIVGIAQGDLQYGEKLPSVRQLAEDLEMNPMTVSKAYQLLKGEGLLETNRQTGTKIVDHAPSLSPMEEEQLAERLMLLLSEGAAKTGNRDEWIQRIYSIVEKIIRKDDHS